MEWEKINPKQEIKQSRPMLRNCRKKMAIVIFFAAYAIRSVSRYTFTPFIGDWPLFGNAVIYTGILVVSLTYFALPIANRLLRHWLYPGSV
jgi:antibiotic biosynthesis monooxygenase (ABM) superfamily enzyme